MVKLDIISDPICPWCYIGKTNLDAALLQFPDHPFTIEWHPFQLNPDMPGDDLCAELMAFAVWEIGGEKIHKRLTDPPTRIEISLRNFHVLFW